MGKAEAPSIGAQSIRPYREIAETDPRQALQLARFIVAIATEALDRGDHRVARRALRCGQTMRRQYDAAEPVRRSHRRAHLESCTYVPRGERVRAERDRALRDSQRRRSEATRVRMPVLCSRWQNGRARRAATTSSRSARSSDRPSDDPPGEPSPSWCRCSKPLPQRDPDGAVTCHKCGRSVQR